MDSKLFLRALKGQKTERPPVWLMRQAGRYLPEYRKLREQAGSFLDLCYTPDYAVEVTLQPLRRFSLDAAILFADILLLPHALGQSLSFREGEGPVLSPIRSVEEVAALRLEDIHDRLAPVYETVARLSSEIPAETALIGFAGAPWTVATYMVEGGSSPDHAIIKRWAYGDPDGFQKLIDVLVEGTVAYLLRQIEAGAEAIQIFDTWAGALPEPAFRRWCIEPARAIVGRLRSARPDIPIIGFPRGAGVGYGDYAAETGVDGLSIDTAVPVEWAARALQPKTTIQGNLDPQMLVVGGEAMVKDAQRILGALGKGPHIFNLGHGIVPQTPPDHVARLVEVVHNWRP